VVDELKVKRNIRLIVAAVAIFAVCAIVAVGKKLSSPRILNAYELRDYGAMMLEEPTELVEFALTDQHGSAFGPEQLLGRWTLVFFGFSHCTDICPTTMAVLSETYQALKPEEQADLNVIMVTVDPQRDTPEQLQKYLARFDPSFIGLSGEHAALMGFARQLHSAYEPEFEGEDNYQVTHSGNLILINPEGELHGYFRPPFAHGGLRVAWRSIRETF
jgi:protein SCO1/2